MTNIHLFFIILFISGSLINAYKDYALKKGLHIGLWFDKDTSLIRMLGTLSLFGSFIVAFFYIKWYYVLIGAVLSFLSSFIILAVFGKNTQIFSIILFVISWFILLGN